MLEKNVYILYPPGYSGSYLNWAISISDKDLHSVTVKNPINTAESTRFGGPGTSHNHVRIPTHQDIFKHLAWVIHNRPIDKKVYIINTGTNSVSASIGCLMQSDPTGVIVVIHNNNDWDTDAYGTINCITKWQTFAQLRSRMLDMDSLTEHFDFFGSSRDYRNFIVKNHANFFMHMEKLNRNVLSETLNKLVDWYAIRNKFQPHEVNESTYVTDYCLNNRLFEISCLDIASKNFPAWIEQFMHDSNASNSYNCDYVREYHDNYINAQPNLEWFNSISSWEINGTLTDYLVSHCGVEAHVILKIFKASNKHMLSGNQQNNWINFYNKVREYNWPSTTQDEHEFYALPDWIQNEILNTHGYCLTVKENPNPVIFNLDWENMSTEEINQVYQESKQRK